MSQEYAHWELIGAWQACTEVSDAASDLVGLGYLDDTLTVLRSVVSDAESVSALLNAAEQEIGTLGLDLASTARITAKMLEVKARSYRLNLAELEKDLSRESSASFVIGDCAVLKNKLKEWSRGTLS